MNRFKFGATYSGYAVVSFAIFFIADEFFHLAGLSTKIGEILSFTLMSAWITIPISFVISKHLQLMARRSEHLLNM